MPTRRTTNIPVDGVALRVDIVGMGAPVVCLHAVGHDCHDFDALADRLSDSHQFFMLDWPGQGQSGDDNRPASAERYADLAEGVIRSLGLQDPIIIGNSIGGAVAIRLATRHRLRGLVLCDSGGLVEITPAVTRICSLFERFFAAGEQRKWWFAPAFALYYSLVLPGTHARTQRRRIVGMADKSSRSMRQAWASFGQPESDIRDMAASLDLPVWVAWAKGDKVIPLKYCLAAIKRLRRYRLTIFEGGHSPFLEQPDEFAVAFRDFVASIPPG